MKLHKLTSDRWDFEGVGDQRGFKVHDNKSWGAFLEIFRLSFRDGNGRFVHKKSFKHYKSRITDAELQNLIAGKSTRAAFLVLKKYKKEEQHQVETELLKDKLPAIPPKKLPIRPAIQTNAARSSKQEKLVNASSIPAQENNQVVISSTGSRLMHDFNQDLFHSTLAYFVGYEKLNALRLLSCVSHALHEKAKKTIAELLSSKKITINDLPGDTLTAIRTYSTNVRELFLTRSLHSHIGNIVSICPNLETLSLDSCHIESDFFSKFANPNNLSRLGIHLCTGVTDEGLSEIDRFQSLTFLYLGDFLMEIAFTDLTLARIANISTLTQFGILGRCEITNDGLALLTAKLTKLTKLTLRQCFKITGHGLAEISKCKSLNHLDLTVGDINDGLIENAGQLTHLTFLSLSESCKITDKGVRKIFATLTNLTSLTLRGSNITNDAFEEIANLTHLTLLDIAGCPPITGQVLAEIAKLPNLIELRLSSKMTDADLAQFSTLTKEKVKLVRDLW